jgi:hypothetical protein
LVRLHVDTLDPGRGLARQQLLLVNHDSRRDRRILRRLHVRQQLDDFLNTEPTGSPKVSK